MTEPRPVILVALDAAEITLLDALCEAGQMPVLQALRARGRRGRLAMEPQAFLSMVWPTFISSASVLRHGWYYNKVWRPETMRLEYARHEWLPLKPFWEALDPSRFRIALLDVPFAADPPATFRGSFLNGWQNHDGCGTRARPHGLWSDLKSKFGRPALRPELFGEQDAASLLRLRREVLAATEQFSRISASLLAGGDWNLFLTVFGGAHRGGHYLWNLTQIEQGGLAPETLRTLESSRVEIYQACDRALGRLLAAAPANARILVFALHGMGPNPGWADYFVRMVEQIQSGRSGARSRSGIAYRLKKALPWKLARQVTTRLPASLNQALVPLWSRRMYDWSATKYFPLPLDIDGYLRINLKGREPLGIVEPGSEYDDLCSELAEAFLSFKDIDTGEPVVAAADKVADMLPGGSSSRQILPDLVVRWGRCSALESRGIRSDRYGELRWERGARLASGRSGNHLGQGWYVAAGEGIAPGTCDRAHDIVDLAPTVFRWLGARIPAGFEGSPIPDLAGAAPPATRGGLEK